MITKTTKTPTAKPNLTSSVKVWTYIENENIQKVLLSLCKTFSITGFNKLNLSDVQ